ncbi:hypothetical protein [Actinoplanes sp. NPDC026619]|uniref:hypothetical protein n=1 Tax=Actinoplanes sp. NPDC026619 TaxID=3155798 RepID=UPI0033F5943A
MRPLTVAAVVFAVATGISAVGAGLDVAQVQHGAEVAAMLALAVCVALAGAVVPRPLRRALLIFCLLLAASALVDVIAHQLHRPALPASGSNGCRVDSGYWRSRLRYGQLAEILRFVALACAFQAIRMLPRSPRRRLWLIVTALLLTPPALIGLSPFSSGYQASEIPGLLRAAAPGVLTLAAALALAALTVTRISGRRTENAQLITGVVLMLLPAVGAVETLAGSYRQVLFAEPGGLLTYCLDSVVVIPGPAVPAVVLGIAVAALFGTAPALIALSALRDRE